MRITKFPKSASLPLLFVAGWILASSVSLYSQNSPATTTQEYGWGTVSTQYDGKGFTVSLTVKQITQSVALASLQNSSATILAASGRVIQAKPEFPAYSFCLAIPPNTTLRTSIGEVRTTAANMENPVVLVGYQPTKDTSGMVPVYESLARVGSFPTNPVLQVTGYEWYRGYRLARILVNPYQRQGSGYRVAVSVNARLDLQGAASFMPTTSKSADPQFAEVFKRLIANASELSVIGQAKLAQNDSTGDWIPWGSQAIKLGIAQDAVYRITFQDVQSLVSSAGLIDPTTFRVFNRGKEIPIYVAGEGDGQFSQADYIELPALRNYGAKDYRSIPSGSDEYPQYLDRYTDTSAYWLTWGGSKGLRMDSSGIVPPSTDTLNWYTELVHVEENHQLQFADGSDEVFRQDPRWTSGDIWGWTWLYPGTPMDISVTMTNISNAYPTATVYARCASTTWPFSPPSYKVRISVDASDTLEKNDDTGVTPQILLQANVPVGQLNEGTNAIHVYSLPTPSSVNAIWFDWADAEYPRNLVATSDTLVFGFPWVTGSAVRTVDVSGLSSTHVVVYKYSPRFKRITNAAFSGSQPYVLTFTDTVSPGDRYMLWDDLKVKTPQTMVVKTFPNLRDPSRGADYILVTSKQFESMANSYAAFIGSTYHLRTTVVDVDDIFNEFGYGYPTAESIREFLKSTTQWQAPMPSYVCLVGNSTYDYKHYVTNPDPNYHPVIVVPSYGEPVSDSWLAVLDDSSIVPQMYIGRIPVATADEFTRYFDHVRSYVTAPNDDWNKRYMFFAGGEPQTTGQIEQFHQVDANIITTMVNPTPIGGVALDFYKTANPPTDYGPYTFDQFQNAIDSGAVTINYIGHGATTEWDNNIRLITQLKNTQGRYAMISDFGCSTAKFAEPDINCFAKLFTLDPDGSAIAFVGNSALGFVSIAVTMPPLFYKQFLVNQIYPIEEAHLLGKIEEMNQSGGPSVELNRAMMLTNTLIGDPSIELAIPEKPNLAISAGSVSASPALPSDDEDSLKLIVPYVNTGRVVQDSLTVRIRHTYNSASTDTLLWRRIPLFRDTLLALYPIKDLDGTHTFVIQLNSDGRIPEIQTNDNTANYTTDVLSTSLKVVRPPPKFESPETGFVILNPVSKVPYVNASLTLTIDTTEAFLTPINISAPLGLVTTRVAIPALEKGRTYYWKANIVNSPATPARGSFVISPTSETRWHTLDSTAWKMHSFHDTKYVANVGTVIEDRVTELHVESAGYNDGAVGAVQINGVNVLVNEFARGHTVVVLDTADFAVLDVRNFDTYGFPALVDSLTNYLTGLPTGSLVIELIVDEGTFNMTASARSAIKSIGSGYIDSVGYRDSWAIIGRKGAAPGTVPEAWVKSGSGKAEIDTVITQKVSTGTVESPEIGPAGTWKSASFSGTTASGAALTLSVLGVRKSGSTDTLLVGQPGPTVGLSQYSSTLYPELRLLGTLSANSSGQSPVLSDWSVTVDLPAELAINYQSVTISADTVLEGADAVVQANVYNVGSVPADSVFVRLTSIGAYGIQTVDSVLLGTIAPDSFKTSNFTVPTAEKRGSNTLFVEVDPQQRVNELYKSNNVMSFPLFVLSDTAHPTFTISVDGSPVYNGDYVSSNPRITVDVFDSSPLPITDPTSVILMMDNQLVTLGTSPDSLFESRNGPDKALVTYHPVLLQGEHTLSVQVKDATGNFADTAARQVTFKVETEPGLRDVYNYPNPFAHQTQFTFNLVGSQLPDELKIRIYTIAGRLVQELTVWRGDLRIGFNRVSWDGRDRDGDELANGVYFYKVAMTVNGKSEEVIQKLAIVK